MRTTVTLDDDVAQQIRQRMRERGTGFKETLNELLRRGLRSSEPLEPYATPTFAMGVRPDVDLTKALRLAAASSGSRPATGSCAPRWMPAPASGWSPAGTGART